MTDPAPSPLPPEEYNEGEDTFQDGVDDIARRHLGRQQYDNEYYNFSEALIRTEAAGSILAFIESANISAASKDSLALHAIVALDRALMLANLSPQKNGILGGSPTQVMSVSDSIGDYRLLQIDALRSVRLIDMMSPEPEMVFTATEMLVKHNLTRAAGGARRERILVMTPGMEVIHRSENGNADTNAPRKRGFWR